MLVFEGTYVRLLLHRPRDATVTPPARDEGLVTVYDADGNLVTGSLTNFTIVRYRPEGTRDASFGTDGVKSGVPGTSTVNRWAVAS